MSLNVLVLKDHAAYDKVSKDKLRLADIVLVGCPHGFNVLKSRHGSSNIFVFEKNIDQYLQ